MALFTIVIPTYNNLDELKNCLTSLQNQTLNDFDVIVCIDGSNDGTYEYLSSTSFPFKLTIIEHQDKKNHGRATTRNLVLNKLSSTFVLFIDSDTVTTPNLLEEHYKILQNSDKIISHGSIFYTNENDNLVGYYLNRRGKNNTPYLAEIIPQHFTTQNFAMSVIDFNQTNGFDEIYDQSYGGEDTEYAIRITKELNFKIINNSKAIVYSNIDKTPQKLIKQIYNFGYNNLHLLIKTYPEYNIFRTKFIIKYRYLFLPIKTVYQKVLKYLLYSIINFKFLPYKIKYYILHLILWLEIMSGFLDKIKDLANKTEKA